MLRIVPQSPLPPDFAAPPRLTDYELIASIGRGSYGDVWLARGVTGLYRAVKIVWRDRFANAQPYEREFRGLKQFAAVSLVESRQLALLHVGRDDAAGFFYYVMELADDAETGREIDPLRYVPNTLKEVRHRRGRLPAREVLALAVELARALAQLHTRGLVHRDLKPSNLILVGGVPKLADIGLVATATSAEESIVGNLGYMPFDTPGTPSADVYGLGKVLYELITGRDRDEFPRLPGDLHTFPDGREVIEFNEILIRACAADATRRYPDANVLLDELLLLQAGKSVRRLRLAERHLSRALRAAAVLAIAASVAGAGAWIAQQRANREMALREKAEGERDLERRKSVYSAGLARAQRALETADFGRARRLLQELVPAAGAPDLRGFEWHALWREAQGDPAEVLRASGPTIVRVRASPDGKLLATHSFAQAVTLWDVATRREIRTINRVVDIAGFSADGKWLVGTNKKLELQRWSVANGEPAPGTAPGINRPLLGVGSDEAISFVDGRNGAPNLLRTWNFSQAQNVTEWTVPSAPDGGRWDFFHAAVSPDARLIAIALITGRSQEAAWGLWVIDRATGREIFAQSQSPRVRGLSFSRDGSLLAVGYEAELALLELGAGRWRWRTPTPNRAANVLGFDAADTRLAFAGDDATLRLVSTATGQTLGERRGHASGVTDLAWLADALVTGDQAGDVRLWSFGRPTPVYSVDDLGPTIAGGRSMCFSADGAQLAITDMRQGVRVYSSGALTELAHFPTMRQPMVFLPGGQQLLGIDATGAIQRCDLPSGHIETLAKPESRISPTYPAASADGGVALFGDTEGRLHWWTNGARTLATADRSHVGAIWWCAVADNGRLALSSGEDRRLRLWDGVTQTLIATANSAHGINHAAILADNTLAAVALANGEVEIRRLPDLALIRTLRTSHAAVEAVAFAHDGSRLWCTGTGGEVSVFSGPEWRELLPLSLGRTFTPRPSQIYAGYLVAADQAGSVLGLCTEDGRLRIWRR